MTCLWRYHSNESFYLLAGRTQNTILQELSKLPTTWVFVNVLLHLSCKICEPCQITVAKNWNKTALEQTIPHPRRRILKVWKKICWILKDPQQGAETLFLTHCKHDNEIWSQIKLLEKFTSLGKKFPFVASDGRDFFLEKELRVSVFHEIGFDTTCTGSKEALCRKKPSQFLTVAGN